MFKCRWEMTRWDSHDLYILRIRRTATVRRESDGMTNVRCLRKVDQNFLERRHGSGELDRQFRVDTLRQDPPANGC